MLNVILKRLVGTKEQKENQSIDVQRTMQVEEFYDPRGVSGSRIRINRKIETLKTNLSSCMDRKKRYLASVTAKLSKVKKAKKKTLGKQEALEVLETKTAAARAERDAAKYVEEEAQAKRKSNVATLEEPPAKKRKNDEDDKDDKAWWAKAREKLAEKLDPDTFALIQHDFVDGDASNSNIAVANAVEVEAANKKDEGEE